MSGTNTEEYVKDHVTPFLSGPEASSALNSADVTTVVASFASREAATVDEVVALAERLTSAFRSDQSTSEHKDSAVVDSGMVAVPAVDPANSVKADKVTCLCCGKDFTMLKRHLRAEHGLTEAEYRARFNLSADHPLVAPNYSKRKADYAKRIGLGKYTRSLEAVSEETRSQ